MDFKTCKTIMAKVENGEGVKFESATLEGVTYYVKQYDNGNICFEADRGEYGNINVWANYGMEKGMQLLSKLRNADMKTKQLFGM